MTTATPLTDRMTKALRMFDALPEELKTDFIAAGVWARNTLTMREGAGHHFELSASCTGDELSCSFAKPEWPGDHSGSYRATAAEAICIAICEYLAGV